jgi:hypothetical protein
VGVAEDRVDGVLAPLEQAATAAVVIATVVQAGIRRMARR